MILRAVLRVTGGPTVSSTYQVLSDLEKKKGYNKNHEKFKLKG